MKTMTVISKESEEEMEEEEEKEEGEATDDEVEDDTTEVSSGSVRYKSAETFISAHTAEHNMKMAEIEEHRIREGEKIDRERKEAQARNAMVYSQWYPVEREEPETTELATPEPQRLYLYCYLKQFMEESKYDYDYFRKIYRPFKVRGHSTLL
jgi:hypothetical protein